MNWNSAAAYVLVAGAIGCGGTAIVGTEPDANAAPTSDPNASSHFSDGNSATQGTATGPADPNEFVTLATTQAYCSRTRNCVNNPNSQTIDQCTQIICKFLWPLRDGYVADVTNDPKLCDTPRSSIPLGSTESPKRQRFAELCASNAERCPNGIGTWCERAPGFGETLLAAIAPCLENRPQCDDAATCFKQSAQQVKPPSWCPGATPITSPPPPIR